MRFKGADEAIKAIDEVWWAPAHILSTLHRIKNDLENENGNWYGHAEQASHLLDTLDEIYDHDYKMREDVICDCIRRLKHEVSRMQVFHFDRKWHEHLDELAEWTKEVVATSRPEPPS